ncbi:MAG: hypothetical protein WKF36_09185 [Candidatus Nitrosocosmicus sp.]
MSQKGKAVALFVVLTFAVAGLTAVTSLSDSSVAAQGPGNVSDPSVVAQLSGLSQHPHLTPGNVSDPSVVAQTPANDPNNCFRTNDNIDTCPTHSHFKGLSNNTTDCFKIVGEAKVSTGDVQNYTKSVQSFFSLLSADNKLTAINANIAGGSGPITDMEGVWNLMENGMMTRDNRQMVLDEVNSLLASAQPGFTQAQLDALTFCIISEANALGPTPNY